MKTLLCLLALLFLVQITRSRSPGVAQSRRRRGNRAKAPGEQEILSYLMSEDKYDSRVRPQGLNKSWTDTGGPVVVSVNMLIRSISKIDDVNMEYSTQITFREQWVDPRLAYEHVSHESEGMGGYPPFNSSHLPAFLVLPPKNEIWMPDSFFQNEKQARKHNIDKPNVLIRIHRDGSILYSVRLSLVLSCPMNLHNYPMDVQTCLIDLASYAYTTNDIEYIWKENNPIQLKDQVKTSLPSFKLVSNTTGYCTSSTNTGVYSCLRTTLTLERQFSYYLLQLYVPSSMLVIVSWVSFWLDKSAVPARVTLGVTTLLTMTTQSSGINAKLPPVSYTKAIDIWIGACMGFIFGALLEFAWVTYLGDKDKENMLKKPPSKKASFSGPTETSLLLNNMRPPYAQPSPHRLRQMPRIHEDSALNPLMQPGRGYGAGTQGHSPPVYAHYAEGGMGTTPVVVAMPTQPAADSLCRLLFRPCLMIRHRLAKEKDRSKRIDFCSRILFPLGFTIFNVAYWIAFQSKPRGTT